MSAPPIPPRQRDRDQPKQPPESDLIRMQNDRNKETLPVDRLPGVSTLLRASREGNEVLLKSALREVIVNGASKEEINMTDKSGRVSQNY